MSSKREESVSFAGFFTGITAISAIGLVLYFFVNGQNWHTLALALVASTVVYLGLTVLWKKRTGRAWMVMFLSILAASTSVGWLLDVTALAFGLGVPTALLMSSFVLGALKSQGHADFLHTQQSILVED